MQRIHPEDRERTERQFIDAVRGGVREYNAEYRIVRPNDGQVRWISVKAEIERDAAGGAVRLVGAHIDITDRKLAEQAVRESEQRFRLVSESAPVMLWMGDVKGKCLHLNRALREFWGVAPEDVAVLSIGTPRCIPTMGRPLRACSGRPCATTRPSPSRPATAASMASTAWCARTRSPASAPAANSSA